MVSMWPATTRDSGIGCGGFTHRARDFDDMPIGAAEMGQARLLLRYIPRLDDRGGAALDQFSVGGIDVIHGEREIHLTTRWRRRRFTEERGKSRAAVY